MNEVSSTYQERRKRPRFSIDLPFDCKKIDAPYISAGIVVNASDTGFLIHFRKNFPVGTKLNITIFFPKGFRLDNLDASGEVVWKNPCLAEDEKGDPFDYGFRIHQIKEADMLKLRGLLKVGEGNIGSYFLANKETF